MIENFLGQAGALYHKVEGCKDLQGDHVLLQILRQILLR